MGALDGKVALVTGGTSGIGRAIATGLAREGATVVLLARDAARGEGTAAGIRATVPRARIEVIVADLASQASIRAAVAAFTARHPRLNLLVGSAGVFHKTRSETVDGIESTFAVNYLSHFLLANLLEEPLKQGAPARVILVASRYGGTRIDFDDLMVERRKFTIMNSVPPTKLAEVLLAQELAERWGPFGITVNAIHPGLVARTHLLLEVGGMWRWLTNTFGGTPEKGADSALWLACAPEAAQVTGQLIAKRKRIPTPGQGSDRSARQRLWEESIRLTTQERPRDPAGASRESLGGNRAESGVSPS
ncbi:MAG TPA: SDR family NAD(P)-dependent oxidoreductase [Thermoplasmata archaeon]|nr:SDR family NAD(P)-dependent oxidoreductase [Thermoplasmata archaeon]